MKKFGFTLQEILIAFFVIGIAAALVIPVLVKGSNGQVYATKLAATVFDFENALTTMIASEAAEDLTDTKWFQSDCDPELLSNNYGIQALYNSGNSGKYKAENVDGYTKNKADNINYDVAFRSNNGALIFIDKEENPATRDNIGVYLGRIYFDMNGEENPNTGGRDIFGYAFTDTGHLYPFGSERASSLIYDSKEKVWTNGSCADANVTIDCTARLAENGYKVDY